MMNFFVFSILKLIIDLHSFVKPYQKEIILQPLVKLLCLTALISFAAQAAAESVDVDLIQSPQNTTTPPGARFEIVQSSRSVMLIFRLDRFSGQVWQFTQATDDSFVWSEMEVIERPTVSSPTRARFQLFTSGLMLRNTFLLDGDTGKSWLVVSKSRKDKEGNEYEIHLWQPLASH